MKPSFFTRMPNGTSCNSSLPMSSLQCEMVSINIVQKQDLTRIKLALKLLLQSHFSKILTQQFHNSSGFKSIKMFEDTMMEHMVPLEMLCYLHENHDTNSDPTKEMCSHKSKQNLGSVVYKVFLQGLFHYPCKFSHQPPSELCEKGHWYFIMLS